MSGGFVPSRIVLAGRVTDADGLRELMRAISTDAHRNGGGAPSTQAEVLDLLEGQGNGPVELPGGSGGARDFAETRKACERIGVAYVHEYGDGRLGRCDFHDPRSAPGERPVQSFAGTLAVPAIDYAAFSDAHAYDDEELGAAFRRACYRIGRALDVAAGTLSVEAEAVDEVRNASLPARGRGLL